MVPGAGVKPFILLLAFFPYQWLLSIGALQAVLPAYARHLQLGKNRPYWAASQR